MWTRVLRSRVIELAGMKAYPNPVPALRGIYDGLMVNLAKMPPHAVYRQGTEAIVKSRLALLNQYPDSKVEEIEEIEHQVGQGRIEELILAAELELSLSEEMLKWEPWESLEEHAEPGQWQCGLARYNRAHRL